MQRSILTSFKRNLIKVLHRAGFPEGQGAEEWANIILHGLQTPAVIPSVNLVVLSFDADRIHSFVFETSTPLEIIGASHRLKKLNTDLKSGLGEDLPTAVIYSGGGSGILIAAPNDVEPIMKRISAQFSELTPTLGVTCAYELVPLTDLGSGRTLTEEQRANQAKIDGKSFRYKACSTTGAGFGSIIQRIGLKLRLAKSRKTYADTIETSPLALRCKSNSRRTAQIQDRQENDRISAISSQKREWGRAESQANDQARHFQQLIDQGSEKNYIGVIYLDGNRMGSLIESLRTIEQFSVFSTLVEEGFKQALETGLENANQARPEPLPHLAPITGGDDILLLVEANYALTLARDIGQAVESYFEQQNSDLIRKTFDADLVATIQQIGLGIGVIIADVKFPIRYLVDYAENLLKSAKRLTYQNTTVRSAIDFLVITGGSPISTKLEELRKTRYERIGDNPNETLKLTAKPYSLPDFERLIADAEAMSELPSSQFRQLHRSLESGQAVSDLFFRYQFARLDPGKLQQVHLKGFISKSIWKKERLSSQDQPVFTTRLSDLLEIQPFLTAGGDHET